ncbi:MAG: winged helix-turn-helix domain-containing protein [Candidatus Poseidoniaceae archaeon]|jgi:DNA-binding transcriptional ArsR family regulator|nr:hypothetical protein [Euryarchaeota archaeon]
MRIHANPVSTALMHPTRRALYLALLGADEHTTVQLQKIVNVDRYNLYHHLQKLADLGLIINHRDEGRARWWCVLQRVPLPNDGHTTNNDGNEIQIDLSSPLAQAKAKRLIAEMQEWISEKVELENYSLESIKFTGRKL